MNVDELRSLSRAEATGEFICADRTDEVHVHLQRGRIAWATASSAPFEFACHIRERGRIDHATFRSVVEACWQSRLPLGETLIGWGLVTPSDVEHALTQQVLQALALLQRLRAARCLFLSRPLYLRYNSALTLALSDDLLRRAPVREERVRTPPRRVTLRAADLAAEVTGAAWITLLRNGEIVEATPSEARSKKVPEAFRLLLSEGADLVALRSPSESLLVTTTTYPGTHLYCGLANDALFGQAVTRLSALPQIASLSFQSGTPPASTDREPARPREEGELWTSGSNRSSAYAAIRALVERSHELMAAVVLDVDSQTVSAVGRREGPASFARTAAERRSLLLASPPEHSAATSPIERSAPRRCVVGSDGSWCFGAHVDRESAMTAWLFVTRSTSHGLGWTLLSALLRALRR